MLDAVIRGGDVIDGSGSPRRRADVGINAGRIQSIGRVTDEATSVIDAEGMVVAPGFIDVHTHLDAQVFWDPDLSPSSLHGVTTVIGGNCGFSLTPLTDASAEYVMRMLSRVEGIPLPALVEGVPWNWHTTSEYLALLEGRLAINAGFMAGHSAIRRAVMGDAANEREATSEELDAMKASLRECLAAGAFGFSTSLSRTHNDMDRRPVPSRFASQDEFVALASMCRDFEGTVLAMLPSADNTFPDEIVELMISMSLAADRPINWNAIVPYENNLADTYQKLAASDRARERGAKIIALARPERDAIRLNFASAFVLDALNGWAEAMALPADEKLQLLRDPVERAKLAELAEGSFAPGGLNFADWARHRILETFTEATKPYEGRLVADVAEEEAKNPFDALVDIVCADDLRTVFAIEPAADTRADWECRVEVLRDRRVVIGASDAGAHVDMAGDFNYMTRLFSRVVREQGLMSTEEAVHLLTEVPSSLYGLRDRGLLAEGFAADLVIFDEDSIGTKPLQSRFDLPAGAQRLFAEPIGISHVIVNGVTAVRDGEFTGQRSGAVLRSGRDTASPRMD